MGGIEPPTSSLPRKCSTPELHGRKPCRQNSRTCRSRLPQPLERVMGIEPTSSAWKAEVLPLNYTRGRRARRPTSTCSPGHFAEHFLSALRPLLAAAATVMHLVEGGGFEPPKAEPADLQSAPFGHSGTPPKNQARNSDPRHGACQQRFVKNPRRVTSDEASVSIAAATTGL